MENPKPPAKTKVKAGCKTPDVSTKAKVCPPPSASPLGDYCINKTPSASPYSATRPGSGPQVVPPLVGDLAPPRTSEGVAQVIETQRQSIPEVQSFQANEQPSKQLSFSAPSSQRQSESSSPSIVSSDCKYNFLKLLQPGNAGDISESRCCPYGDMQFPCSWFASPKYFHLCSTRRCCKSVCVFHDERKVCQCVGSKCNELGPRVSSNTLHGVRSVNDLRSWSVCCEDQRRYFLEQMLKSRGPVEEVHIEDDIPREASPMQIRYENLLNKKDDEIERLKKQILELQQKKTEAPPARKKSDPKTPPRKKSVEFQEEKPETPERKPSEPEPAPSPPRKKSSLVEPEPIPSPPRKKSSLVEPEPIPSPPRKKSSLVESEPIPSPPRKKSSVIEPESKESESEAVTTPPRRKSSGHQSLTQEVEEELFPEENETVTEEEVVEEVTEEEVTEEPTPTEAENYLSTRAEAFHALAPSPSQPLAPSPSQPLAPKEPPPPPTKQKSLPHFTPVEPGLLHEPGLRKKFVCNSCEKPPEKTCQLPPVFEEERGLPCDLDSDMPIEDPYNLIVKLDGNKIVKSQGGQVLEVLEPEELVAELEWLRESMMANGDRVHELEDALLNVTGQEGGLGVGYDYDQCGAQIEQLNSQLDVMREEHGFLESRLVEKEMNEKHLHTTLESTANQLNQYREDCERCRILLREAEEQIQTLVQRIMELEGKAGGMPSNMEQQQPRHPPGPCGQLAAYFNNNV
ncbi:hypothetical protein Ocin01_01195 [Orchesella cincta]|uniref:Uncharacterized protein n=1 Tax=Orchesella cincta TaxID=48709 RepID=A0A1D2NJR2_ORCCI|nr:hypothetical protein Ocin01_01195 [Orchesella cincta]